MELSSSALDSSSSPQLLGALALPFERNTNVAMRPNNLESKFDGDLGESWSEYVDSYIQIAKDYNFSMDHKLHYLHNRCERMRSVSI